MSNYIVCDTQEHYFYKPYEGLCMRRRKNTVWQEYQILYPQALDNFGLYRDEGGSVHILCANTASEIVYLLRRENTWHKYTLTTFQENARPETIRLCAAGGRLQFLYSVKRGSEYLLVHCILGDHAQPTPIDNMHSTDFFISGDRVYYTNANGILGFQSLTDGKPNRFEVVCENACMPYLLSAGNTTFLTYVQDNAVCFQGKPIYACRYAENPILLQNENRLLLLWREGDFVRYLTSLNSGESWSTPMQFVNPGKSAVLYTVQQENSVFYCYGNHSDTALHIFGTNDLFDRKNIPPKQTAPANSPFMPEDRELSKIKIMIDLTRSEIVELKREIQMLKRETDKIDQQLLALQPIVEEENDAG